MDRLAPLSFQKPNYAAVLLGVLKIRNLSNYLRGLQEITEVSTNTIGYRYYRKRSFNLSTCHIKI